jgi:hypothetical protein
MANTAKATKAQLKTLEGIWTQRTAAGISYTTADGNRFRRLIDTKTATQYGFSKLNGNACASLLGKGFIQLLTTTVTHTSTSYGRTYVGRIQVAVLTDAGRAAIGV